MHKRPSCWLTHCLRRVALPAVVAAAVSAASKEREGISRELHGLHGFKSASSAQSAAKVPSHLTRFSNTTKSIGSEIGPDAFASRTALMPAVNSTSSRLTRMESALKASLSAYAA